MGTGNEINFDQKVLEIFKSQILCMVRKTYPGAKYVVELKGDDPWCCLDIPLGESCNYKLSVNYDMKAITVECVNPKRPITPKGAELIRHILSEQTNAHNEDWGKSFVWVSASVKYPGLEDIKDDGVYKYELYRIYSENPQSVVDKILGWAGELYIITECCS